MKKKIVTKQQLSIRRIILLSVTLAAILIVAQLLYYAHISLDKEANHERVKELIDNEITFEKDQLDIQLQKILDWIENENLSNEDLGRLYERASLIYQQKGDEMTYYRYLGYALYYLEHSDAKDYTVNIYLDLANFYYVNRSFNRSQNMIDRAREVEDFDKLENLQVKSYAYRMQAIMDALNGNYSEAEELLNKASDVLKESTSGIFEDAYKAINDIWLGYVYLETGRIDECGNIIDEYKDSPFQTQSQYREFLLRDFVLPYNQTKCYYYVSMANRALQEGNPEEYEVRESQAMEVLSEFMANCEKYGYESHELVTITKLKNQFPEMAEKIQTQVYEKLDGLYSAILEEKNESYAGIIDSQIKDSAVYMDSVVSQKEANTYRGIIITAIVVLIIMVVTIVVVVIVFGNVDGLSNIYNRKKFDKRLAQIKKKNIQYCIIMMDIDNFKKINDTYGHLNGDTVIQRVGEILSREVNDNVKAYRYGGEEFVLMLTREACDYAEFTAERVRRSMEQQLWDFSKDLVVTLSLGVAFGKGDKEVLEKADENLYKSKQTGKNKMTMEW